MSDATRGADAPARASLATLPGPWDRFGSSLVPPKEVVAVRRALYHSEGPGYVVLPGFLDGPYLEHIQRFWLETKHSESDYAPYEKRAAYPVGYPPMKKANERRVVYSHFWWNTPTDQLSTALALAVQSVRNLVEGSVPHHGLVPDGSRVLNWRVVVSKHSDGDEVPPHNDMFPGESAELARLQATLFLTDPGRDWTGEGFALHTNQGTELCFGRDVAVEAGDLVLWRYVNRHRVGGIATPEGGRGLARMIFPLERSEAPEVAAPRPPASTPGSKDPKNRKGRSSRGREVKKLLWKLNAARRRWMGGA